MQSQFTGQLQEIRQQVPIGLRHALLLLKKTQGNVAAAAQLFKQEMVDLVVNKTSVEPHTAERHLVKANYDASLALRSIDEERLTLTERILLRYRRNKSEALGHILLAIEETTSLKRDYWLDISALQKLNRPQACFALVYEWMCYEEWEGVFYAIHYHLDLVAAQLEQELQQTATATILLTMRERHAALQSTYPGKLSMAAINSIVNDKLLQDYDAEFEQQKPLLIDRLYAYVQEHISSFP
jgi:hypothetical protein